MKNLLLGLFLGAIFGILASPSHPAPLNTSDVSSVIDHLTSAGMPVNHIIFWPDHTVWIKIEESNNEFYGRGTDLQTAVSDLERQGLKIVTATKRAAP